MAILLSFMIILMLLVVPGRTSYIIAIVYFSVLILSCCGIPSLIFAAAKDAWLWLRERNNPHGGAPQLQHDQREQQQHNRHGAVALQLHGREQYNNDRHGAAALQVHIGERVQIARVGMRGLPSVKSFQRGVDIENGSQSECAICVEEFKDGESVQPFGVCVHVFHVFCIQSWLYGGKTTCPVYRKDLSITI
ncbi:E3 ubiquitin-protein ligase ATL41-like [Lotus japonicus]|uniref:E3 ubiquitin-protein ligase ATL41-like n=1 Tax=Lotus japonicus TaxID=34305 RepID=UPI00258F87E4|nr:E3 ubiquitin-protein ligase ATL41-like [Lotus japonicus]